jgi:hypothetical protein
MSDCTSRKVSAIAVTGFGLLWPLLLELSSIPSNCRSDSRERETESEWSGEEEMGGAIESHRYNVRSPSHLHHRPEGGTAP